MAERINEQAGADVARIATSMPMEITSGELLKALHQAWRAGYSEGFGLGVLSGQKHLACIMDMVHNP